MDMRKALVTALAGCALGLASSAATAAPCTLIQSIGDWQAAGSCEQGDKTWTLNGVTNLGATVSVDFSPVDFAMQLSGFDNSTAAGSWGINYSILVTDPNFVISAMSAGADNPFGTSNLTKDVTGDAVFQLTVVDGVEGPGSQIAGLSATALTINEAFSVGAGGILLSVSNAYFQKPVQIPEPGTLALMGGALAGLVLVRRRRN